MKNNLRLVKKNCLPEPVEFYFARVILVEQDETNVCYSIQLNDNSIISALKAESCLLLPEVNDLILASSCLNEGNTFILQILTRNSSAKVVDLGENAMLRATNLKLDVQKEIGIQAPAVELSGLKATAKFSHSSLLSNWCEIRTKKSLFIAESAEKIINTVTEKIVNIFKTVEGIEFSKANRIRTIVTGRLFYKARHLTLNAEEEIGIDGKKINMG